MEARPFTIGITCFPLIGGSGILATALGTELAVRGHTVHFFSYAKPVRLDLPRREFIFTKSKLARAVCFHAPITPCRSP